MTSSSPGIAGESALNPIPVSGGDFLPIADNESAWTIVDMDDPINPGRTIQVLSFPRSTGGPRVVFACCVDGDAFPRYILVSDGTNGFGDGDTNLWLEGPYLQVAATNSLLIATEAEGGEPDDGRISITSSGDIQIDSGDQHTVINADQIQLVSPTGTIVLPNLPTADPGVAGQLWSNLGIVTVSAG